MRDTQALAYKAQARQVLGTALASISGWETLTYALEDLGFHAEGQRLRGSLHEVYGNIGDLLSKLAPWRDGEQAAPPEAAVIVPDEGAEPDAEATDAEA